MVMVRESNKWEKITALSSLALAVLALIALVFSYRQIVEFHHEAQVQHLSEAVHDFDYGPVSKSLNALARKRVNQSKEALNVFDEDNAPSEMYDVADFFDYVGLLTKRGYLDKTDIWDTFGYYLFNFYADARPMIDAEQKKDRDMFANLTWLIDAIRQIEDDPKHQGAEDHPTPNDVYGFYSGYIDSAAGVPPAHGPQHKN